jgi:transposase-like protein
MSLPTLRYQFPDSRRLFCPKPSCRELPSGPRSRRFVRHGSFYRTSDRSFVSRFLCRNCRSTFSRATLHPCFRQKKRQVNFPLWHLKASQVTQRRSAHLLGIDRKTVARKLQFLGAQARLSHEGFLKTLVKTRGPRLRIQLDEMETFEHTKCKPVSVPLIVDVPSRLILGVDACSMPANGPLAEISRRKYGPRANHRMPTLRRLIAKTSAHLDPQVEVTSDSHPYYPPVIRAGLPQAAHLTVKGRKSASTGQGELKKVRWDPIFSLNHTAAMTRANMSRLVRKTWCTTKKLDRLKDHLFLYAVWHNQRIWEKWHGKEDGGSQGRLLLEPPGLENPQAGPAV